MGLPAPSGGQPRPTRRRRWPLVALLALAILAILTVMSSSLPQLPTRSTFSFPIPYRPRAVQRAYSRYTEAPQTPIHDSSDKEEQWTAANGTLREMTDLFGTPVVNALKELHYALETMQTSYFQLWVGMWPDAIDWTAAVMGTYMSASLYSLTRSLDYILPWQAGAADSKQQAEGQKVENEINKYFSQSVAYYFGEDSFSIRMQAYDDMLWVVLGWLENIRFIQLHCKGHYPATDPSSDDGQSGGQGSWHGEQFSPAFAHRARVFYDLAKQGWDTKLCGGGMNWNPYKTPYKNAITNELYISASVGMYLYFPGDDNDSPFITRNNLIGQGMPFDWPEPAIPHDPAYLRSAVAAYNWLKHSNMTNDLGLYVDGFHIRHYGVNGTIGTGNCDVRNEMVYTYNQGVLLSGLRGLWEATGKIAYLQDGHALVRAVINATGWDIATSVPKDKGSRKWQGLGRGGILEEYCDASGRCNQNGQTFKGIYFHHLTLFCEPLPTTPLIPGLTHTADPDTSALHAQSCREYAAWVAHNAVAAMTTRDNKGRFGMWWGASDGAVTEETPLPPHAIDYRNWDSLQRPPFNKPWTTFASNSDAMQRWGIGDLVDPPFDFKDGRRQWFEKFVREDRRYDDDGDDVITRDLNDRGRGRTVETQGGGVAVVRAIWEFVHMYRGKDGS